MKAMAESVSVPQERSEESSKDLRKRTMNYALAIIHLYQVLPKTSEAQIIGKQALRSGTSVGAHYREAQRAKSDADFISKIESALQELDETTYWLELLHESGIVRDETINPLTKETEELIAIFVTIVKKVKSKSK